MSFTALALLLAAAVAQPPEPAASQPSSAPASRPAEPEWALLPSHRPPEAADDPAYQAWCRKKCDELIAKAQHAAEPEDAVRFRLAAANSILAQLIEPPVSRWLLHIPQPEDLDTIHSGLAEARKLIGLAAEALPAAPEGGDPNPPGPRAALDALQSFASALHAIWSDAPSDESAAARQSAAARLAVLLEDDRKDVAAAALLWQAVLYATMGQPEPTLQLLPEATARVSREARSYQFQSRLLRCRLLTQRGGFTAAAALLLQVEEKSTEWFTVEAEQDAAIHAAMLGRLQALEKWRAALDPEKESSEIAWCDKAIARLKADAVAEGNPVHVLGLEKTIPLLVSAPDAGEPLVPERDAEEAPEKQH